MAHDGGSAVTMQACWKKKDNKVKRTNKWREDLGECPNIAIWEEEVEDSDEIEVGEKPPWKQRESQRADTAVENRGVETWQGWEVHSMWEQVKGSQEREVSESRDQEQKEGRNFVPAHVRKETV